jgi:hypothetical protein
MRTRSLTRGKGASPKERESREVRFLRSLICRVSNFNFSGARAREREGESFNEWEKRSDQNLFFR